MNNKKTKRQENLKQDLYIRLNRIEGQIRGIKGMVEKDTYCSDILNQVLAVKSALDSVNKILLENHINNCLVEKIKNEDEEVLSELMSILKKMIK